MKKYFLTMLLIAPFFAIAAAPADLTTASPSKDETELFFSGENLTLSPQEKAALAISKKWQNSSATSIKPSAGVDGAIIFLFGAEQPSIVCAVLQVCDVALQAGEQVNSIHLGDTARWTVEPAITGSGASEVQHLIIKPMDVGLVTSLIVTTDRRTYHLRLRSDRTNYMPSVAFSYPEDALAKWNVLKSRETKEKQDKTIPKTGEYLGDLNFSYDIDGNAPWKPVRVFNDGTKTIIEMPKAMSQTESPTLLVIRKDGGLFTDDETVLVNYRVQGDRYIVDTLFEKAILISGVGSGQDKITLTKVN